MLSKELTAASTRPLLLSLLEQGESYGYALVQQVKELSGGRIEWSEGMLYPVLHRLEEEGLIEAEWRVADSGKRRKYYRVRRSGRAALQQERQQWEVLNQTFKQLWKTVPDLT